MQINKKKPRTSSVSAHKAKRPAAEATRATKTPVKKPARAIEKTERQDQVERRLREELEGTGAQARVRDIVGRLLGNDRSPAVEQMIARLQAAARSETASPYGR